MIQWIGAIQQRLWAIEGTNGACLGHIRSNGDGWDVFVPSPVGTVARLRGCDDAESAARTLCAYWRAPYTPLPERCVQRLGTLDLAAARGAYSAWANVCGGDNPEEPDPLLLGVALREVDRLSTELAKAREAAWEDGRRVELEEAASLCAPRAHGGTAPGMFVKASRLADEIRAIGAKPRGNA